MSLACRVIVDTHVKATYLLGRERSVSCRLNARIHIPEIVGGRATRTRRQGDKCETTLRSGLPLAGFSYAATSLAVLEEVPSTRRLEQEQENNEINTVAFCGSASSCGLGLEDSIWNRVPRSVKKTSTFSQEITRKKKRDIARNIVTSSTTLFIFGSPRRSSVTSLIHKQALGAITRLLPRGVYVLLIMSDMSRVRKGIASAPLRATPSCLPKSL